MSPTEMPSPSPPDKGPSGTNGSETNRNAGFGFAYAFLFLSLTYNSDKITSELDMLSYTGAGVEPFLFFFGILIVGGIAVLGLYSRTLWGLVGSIGVFGLYSSTMFYIGEVTISAVAAYCVLYFLSRSNIVLESNSAGSDIQTDT